MSIVEMRWADRATRNDGYSTAIFQE